jgi:hypothetical protein
MSASAQFADSSRTSPEGREVLGGDICSAAHQHAADDAAGTAVVTLRRTPPRRCSWMSPGGRDADQFVRLDPHSPASSRDRLAYAALALPLSGPTEDECALVRTWSPALSIRRER